MRTDHRRPLVAYVLVTLACAFVVAPSLDLGGIGLGKKATFSAFSDTTMTPSEAAEWVIDPTNFRLAPDSEPVDEPVTEGEDTFVPNVDVITDAVDELPWVMGDGETADVAGSDSDEGGSQDGSDSPPASLVVSSGPSGDGNGSSGDGDGGAGGATDPDLGDVSGVFDGAPPSDGGPLSSPSDGGPLASPSDGGPLTSPSDGDGATGGSDGVVEVAATGPENGNGHGLKAKGDKSHGSKAKGDKSHGSNHKGGKSHGPKDKARGHDKNHGKAHQSKGSKKSHHRKR